MSVVIYLKQEVMENNNNKNKYLKILFYSIINVIAIVFLYLIWSKPYLNSINITPSIIIILCAIGSIIVIKEY